MTWNEQRQKSMLLSIDSIIASELRVNLLLIFQAMLCSVSFSLQFGSISLCRLCMYGFRVWKKLHKDEVQSWKCNYVTSFADKSISLCVLSFVRSAFGFWLVFLRSNRISVNSIRSCRCSFCHAQRAQSKIRKPRTANHFIFHQYAIAYKHTNDLVIKWQTLQLACFEFHSNCLHFGYWLTSKTHGKMFAYFWHICWYKLCSWAICLKCFPW